MPQMAPYNWLILLLIFNLTFYFINCYIYYFLQLQLPMKNMNNTIKYKWLW